MKRYLLFFLSSTLLMFFISCGKKGPLQHPIVRIPKSAISVVLTQRGDKAYLRWKNPINYIDGNPIAGLSEVEIWLLEKEWSEIEIPELIETDEPVESNWEKRFKNDGRLLLTITKETMPDYIFDGEQENPVMQFIYPLEKDFLSKEYLFSLRVKDIRRRKSLYSTPIFFKAKMLSHPPLNIIAEVFENKILLKWEPPLENIDKSNPPLVSGYNVYRAVGKSKAVLLNPSLILDQPYVLEQTYEDEIFDFGTTYSYFVRVSSSESSPYQESEDSEVLEISPEDNFAPAPPKGVVLVMGPNIISLSWDVNQESDLGGYRVWKRAEGESEFVVLMKEPILGNTYTDTSVEKNIRYYYAITSLDKAGNESLKSNAISEIIRDGFL